MIRILGATGKLFEAAEVVPIAEQRIAFNGSVERKFEVAKSLESATGIMFLKNVLTADKCVIHESEVIEYIGNISAESVYEILSYMVVAGFYDFSRQRYQQEEDMSNIKLGNLYSPYSSAITNALNFGVISNPVPGKTVLKMGAFEKVMDDEHIEKTNVIEHDLFEPDDDECEEESMVDFEEDEEMDDDTEDDGWENWECEE